MKSPDLPVVTFVTDPLCSWCWAMLPAVEAVRRQCSDSLNFDLLLAGLQIGNQRPLDAEGSARLVGVWERVQQTTGQQFSFKVPAGFVFHSEVACRAVEWARRLQGEAPWHFFHGVQEAFFLRGENVNDPAVLEAVGERLGLDTAGLGPALESPELAQATRSGFDRAKGRGAFALPSILLDLGDGPKLVSGGYLDAEYLRLELDLRLQPGGSRVH